MAKKFDFDREKNNRDNNNRDNDAIEEIMQADFPLPKQAEDAKNEAFSRIREMVMEVRRAAVILKMFRLRIRIQQKITMQIKRKTINPTAKR